jgi:hypothetical protein
MHVADRVRLTNQFLLQTVTIKWIIGLIETKIDLEIADLNPIEVIGFHRIRSNCSEEIKLKPKE